MIAPVPLDRYVREVLPLTFDLWSGGRDAATYARDLRQVAASAYLRRQSRFTVGSTEGGDLVTTCKRYERELRWGTRTLASVGIGAVFTPVSQRGRGHASRFFDELLAQERAAGHDVAFLFSDIDPGFYARLGFVALPSRLITLRATSLAPATVESGPIGTRDRAAIRRCFEGNDAMRAWSLVRTPVVWDWIAMKWAAEERPARPGERPVRLLIRRRREALAYIVGRRSAAHDAFVLDDFAYAGEEGRAAVPGLLRTAAGDLTRVSGWLPPAIARDALPRGTVRARTGGAVLMVAPLSPLGRSWLAKTAVASPRAACDPVWTADHI